MLSSAAERSRLRTLPVTAAALSHMTSELASHLQFASIPSFLLPADIDDIFLDAEQRYFLNEFHEAGVKGATVGGGGEGDLALQQRQVISTVRKAHIAWLDSTHPRSIVEGRLLRYLDALRVQLGASLSLDLCAEDTECLYVRYPIGGLYTQHSDSHSPGPGVRARDTERRVSFILYVNASPWEASQGGQLRMLGPDTAPWARPVDLDPMPGTLILFNSRDLLHEVLQTNVVRRAVVGWFRQR